MALVNGVECQTVTVDDRGLLYGDGVFRTMRAAAGRVLHWPQHYQKLQHDCGAIGLACPHIDILEQDLSVAVDQLPNSAVKIIITRGVGMRGYAIDHNAHASRIVSVYPLPQYPAANAESGIKLYVCDMRISEQPRLAGIKHLNRLENVLARSEWQDKEYAEGLLMDRSDNVISGTMSNIFLVKNNGLYTPDLSQCGVAGVQRDRVLSLAKFTNIPTFVEDISLEQLLAADEVFITNSLIGVWPVNQIAHRTWNVGNITKQFQKGLHERDI